MHKDLQLLSPEPCDWRDFLLAAAKEGWRVPRKELELWRGPLADGVLALRRRSRFAGLITLVHHGASAWIGNLLVVDEWRGRGYGAYLLDQAILRLERQGSPCLWLTASAAGLALYQRRGFEIVGQVERWVLNGTEGAPARTPGPTGQDRLQERAELLSEDAGVWGQKRPLLEYLLPEASLLRSGSNVALLQREPGLQILGPWFAAENERVDQERLLTLALAEIRPAEELVIDLRAGAVPAVVMHAAGFVCRGRTRLMVRGDRSHIDLQRLVAFASLGSMG